MLPGCFHEACAERDVVTHVVHAAHQALKLDRGFIRRELNLASVFSEGSALEEAECHVLVPSFGDRRPQKVRCGEDIQTAEERSLPMLASGITQGRLRKSSAPQLQPALGIHLN